MTNEAQKAKEEQDEQVDRAFDAVDDRADRHSVVHSVGAVEPPVRGEGAEKPTDAKCVHKFIHDNGIGFTNCLKCGAASPQPAQPEITAKIINSLTGHQCGRDCECRCGRAYSKDWNVVVAKRGIDTPKCECYNPVAQPAQKQAEGELPPLDIQPGEWELTCRERQLRAAIQKISELDRELPRCEGETLIGAVRNLKQAVLLNEDNCKTLEAKLAALSPAPEAIVDDDFLDYWAAMQTTGEAVSMARELKAYRQREKEKR